MSLKNVFVVEDEPSQRQTLASLLGKRSFSVSLAADTEGAVAQVNGLSPREPFAASVVDWKIPPHKGDESRDEEGLSVIVALSQRFPNVPIIITTSGSPSSAVRERVSGFKQVVDVLDKPVWYSDIVDEIVRLTGNHSSSAHARQTKARR